MLSTAASLIAQLVKNLPAMQETWVQPLGWEDPLEKEMAIHSSILAWKIPLEEPGKLQPMGSQSRARLSDFTSPHLTFLFLVRPTATSQACHTGAQGAEGATQLLARGSSLAFVANISSFIFLVL